MTETMTEIFGEVISSYSRQQAIEDGELVDVSQLAKECGFTIPVAVTRNLWASHIVPCQKAKGTMGQSETGRLWDVLSVLLWKIRASDSTTHIEFKVLFQNGPRPRADKQEPTLWADCGPGDNAEPVITIMLPEDY